MRRPVILIFCALVLTGATGCIDTWAAFGRAERNLKNELADYMIKIVDEETAEQIVEGPAKKIAAKWEDHKNKMSNFIKAQDLGQIEAVFKRLEQVPSGKQEQGTGQRKRIFTKHPDGRITMDEGTAEGSMKETIDTLTDPDYQKAMSAAVSRMKEQSSRISRILPSGPYLQKARDLPKGTFGS